MVGAEITDTVLSIELHLEEIFDFLYKSIILSNPQNQNIGKKAYETLIEHIASHPSLYDGSFNLPASFYGLETTSSTSYGIKACYERSQKNNKNEYFEAYVVIFRDRVNEILKNAGIINVDRALQDMLDEGYIASEHMSKRLTYKKVLVNDVNIPMIHLYVHQDYINNYGEYCMAAEIEKCNRLEVKNAE